MVRNIALDGRSHLLTSDLLSRGRIPPRTTLLDHHDQTLPLHLHGFLWQYSSSSNYLGWVWFKKLSLVKTIKKLSFQKVHNEKVLFQKVKSLVKTVKKCFLKKLSVWLALIKVEVWVINYQKGQDIYIYKRRFFVLIISLNASYGHNIFTKISQ